MAAPCRVYPRGHGESLVAVLMHAAVRGLSPWARGIHRGWYRPVDWNGSIPVGTGNPAGSCTLQNTAGVYPRGHGESDQGVRQHQEAGGLSPWARGIRQVETLGQAVAGSIPVGTGNPQSTRSARQRHAVYPRGHGESAGARPRRRATKGLSPWARGIPIGRRPAAPTLRSIPVGTGNPHPLPRPRSGNRVYPRGHGESPASKVAAVAARGLSPWARGILCLQVADRRYVGSIPVGTGNPPPRAATSAATRVYPRGHGESHRCAYTAAGAAGLSPWARGIHSQAGPGDAYRRSIPVGTGNPPLLKLRLKLGAVYPRGHGESYSGVGVDSCLAGLSPWARGIHSFNGGLRVVVGSIPVGTGNPAGSQRPCTGHTVYPRGHGESLRFL